MRILKHAVLVSLTSVLSLLASTGARAGCAEPVSIMHEAMVPPDGGAFDFSQTAYAEGEGRGPELRFWAQRKE